MKEVQHFAPQMVQDEFLHAYIYPSYVSGHSVLCPSQLQRSGSERDSKLGLT
jgi:hypothetical protein